MGKQGDNFGFFQYTGTYMPARKAYLLISGSAPEFLGFDGEATGVHEVSEVKEVNEVKIKHNCQILAGSPEQIPMPPGEINDESLVW